MFEQRYECLKDNNGTWSVLDKFTGRICEMGHREVSRLRKSDAIEIMEIMNGIGPTPTLH